MYANYHSEIARVGVKWTKDEDEQLMKTTVSGLNINDIAKRHQRTVGAVKIRIMRNAITMMKSKNLTLEEVAKLVHISIEELKNHKQIQDRKQELPYNDNCAYLNCMALFTEIRNYLKILVVITCIYTIIFIILIAIG
jgi:hypothetical protein